jgi:peptidoglycan/xylan/chitin deacetylase (PgdA/CDA1 family)
MAVGPSTEKPAERASKAKAPEAKPPIKPIELSPALRASQAKAAHVPVLLYHHVCTITDPVNVAAEDFDRQMAFLMDNGYQPVGVDQVVQALRGEFELPAKPVAITFDDGWRCAFKNAVPIMNKYGMKATFYIVSTQADGHTFMSWDENRALLKDGHWIGSHTVDHAWLTRLSEGALDKELADSKKRLEAKLGSKVVTMAYPYGSYNEATVKAAQKAGYTGATIVGDGHKCHSPLFEVRRSQVSYGADLNRFRSILGLPQDPSTHAARQERTPPSHRHTPEQGHKALDRMPDAMDAPLPPPREESVTVDLALAPTKL